MNLLVICNEIGDTASGKVIEILLEELFSRKIELSVICLKNNSKSLKQESIHEVREHGLDYSKLWKLNLIFSNRDSAGESWAKIAFQKASILIGKSRPDFVICIGSAYAFRTYALGRKIYKEFGIPYLLHGLDPIPSTKGWGEHFLLRWALKRHIKPYYKEASLISSTNSAMLDYQINILKVPAKTKSFVMYNPVHNIKVEDEPATNDGFNLVYLGTLYAKRNPAALIKAFEKFLNVHPHSNLQFVGRIHNLNLDINKQFLKYIQFIPWTDHPELYIRSAHVLVDIDADLKNDVFLSSKIIQYFNYNKLILAITPVNSPSRLLLKSCKKTMVFSENKVDNIYQQLNLLFEKQNQRVTYEERSQLKKEFTSESIINLLLEKINQVSNN